jgi:2-methylcitrate synthase
MSAPTEIYSPGLEGVIAGETALSTIVEGLSYRGYPVTELVAAGTSFDEVAYLLLHGDLPNRAQLADFHQRQAAARQLPAPLYDLFKALPAAAPPMDVLRSAVSILAHFDPDTADDSPAANLRKAERLLAQIPIAVAAQFRISHGQQPLAPRGDLADAANFLFMLRGKEATPDNVRALDVSLILYAEHEFNASTFAARVVVSTEADLHSGIVAAIGALKGPLHGGANEKVMDLLRSAGGPETAEKWVRDALARKAKIMGFGHRVYKAGDVRAKILKEFAQKSAQAAGQNKWEQAAEIIEGVMAQEKKLFPNLDWPAGRLYHAMGLEVPLYTPIFVMSRVSGWCAHIIEQKAANRIIRPRSRYIGPPFRKVKALAER